MVLSVTLQRNKYLYNFELTLESFLNYTHNIFVVLFQFFLFALLVSMVFQTIKRPSLKILTEIESLTILSKVMSKSANK